MTNPSQSYGATSEAEALAGSGTPPIKEQPLTWILLASKFGVSVQTMKVWRQKEGAPVTTELGLWETWLKKEGLGMRGLSGAGLKDEKTKHEIELLKAKINREQRRVIDRDEVNQLLLHIATRGRTKTYQLLESEAPPKLDGMSAVQMRPILREMADAIADEMADLIDQFQKQ